MKVSTTIIIAILVIAFVGTQQSVAVYAGTKADNNAIGFQDGLSDCATPGSNYINGHSNAGHHSAEYMKGYNDGLNSCDKSYLQGVSGGQNGNNQNNNNRNQALSQGATQAYHCFTVIGNCGGQTQAQGQSLNN